MQLKERWTGERQSIIKIIPYYINYVYTIDHTVIHVISWILLELDDMLYEKNLLLDFGDMLYEKPITVI